MLAQINKHIHGWTLRITVGTPDGRKLLNVSTHSSIALAKTAALMAGVPSSSITVTKGKN